MSVLAELVEKYEARQAELDQILAAVEADGGRDLTPEEEAEVAELVEKRDKHLARIEVENKTANTQRLLVEARRNAGLTVEQRADGNGADMSVEREQTVYGHGSPNSYFADLYYMASPKYGPLHPQYHAAFRRQMEWSHQVEVEMSEGTKFGRFAEKQFRDYYRSPQGTKDGPGGGPDYKALIHEARSRGRAGFVDNGVPGVEMRTGLTTGGGATASSSGGGTAAFVTPIFTEGDYVPFREFGRAFADETTARPLPPYGMAVYMPQVTSGAAVATGYSEGGSVTESDPAQDYISATVTIVAGEVTTSQAVLDRTGPNFEYDVVIWDQLERNYAKNWDIYVLTSVMSAASSQTWTGAGGTFVLVPVSGSLPNAGGFVGQIAKAAAFMETTSGTVMSPTHLFLVPARWRNISAWTDSQGRPVVVPQINGAFNAWAAGSPQGTPVPQGNTGFMLGGLPVFTDNNLPLNGTTSQDQALVCDPKQAWSYEGAPVHRVLPQTLAGNLNVIFQQFSYGAVLERYADAFVRINGTGFSAITYDD